MLNPDLAYGVPSMHLPPPVKTMAQKPMLACAEMDTECLGAGLGVEAKKERYSIPQGTLLTSSGKQCPLIACMFE